jgi:hypothetical protein
VPDCFGFALVMYKRKYKAIYIVRIRIFRIHEFSDG